MPVNILSFHLTSSWLFFLLFFLFFQPSFEQHRLGQTSYERPSYLPSSHPPGMMLRQKSIGEIGSRRCEIGTAFEPGEEI